MFIDEIKVGDRVFMNSLMGTVRKIKNNSIRVIFDDNKLLSSLPFDANGYYDGVYGKFQIKKYSDETAEEYNWHSWRYEYRNIIETTDLTALSTETLKQIAMLIKQDIASCRD